MLEIRNLSAGYGRKKVLHGLNMNVQEGQVTVVVGPNGCGKTSFLKAIVGLADRMQGEVLLNGENLFLLPAQQVARKIAFLQQNRQTPDISVFQLVLSGRFPHLSYPKKYGKKDLDIARSVMAKMGVAEYENRLMSELSGGMRQRAYIAMALAQDTPIVLMDEPTTFLDVSQQMKTMKHARFLAEEGKTVMMVLHDLDIALRTADCLAVMREGRLLRTGTPEEVYQSGCLEAAFGVSVKRACTDDGWRYYYLEGMRGGKL